jgi:hypothetical protein
VPVDVTCAKGIIQQRLGLQGTNDPAAQRLACARVSAAMALPMPLMESLIVPGNR